MKQLLQSLRNGKTTVEDVPVPSVRPGFALVKTAASLVSAGTERMVLELADQNLLGKARARPDLVRQVLEKARREGLLTAARAALSRLDQPLALGYSSAGTIAALGADMRDHRVGQRVACGGAGYAVHAEYAVVPRNLLVPLPASVDFESGAFATLGAVAMHGVRLARPQVGEHVAVIGLGLVGLLAAQIAAAAGCTVLGIEPDSRRLAIAEGLGIRAVPLKRAVAVASALTRSRGFDSVLICADTPSSAPVELAAAIARDRARVVAVGAVGLELPRKAYYDKELSLVNARSYGPGRYDPGYEEGGLDYPIGYVRWTEGRNIEAVVQLMAAGRVKVKPLISHRFPIEQARDAYELIRGKKKAPYLGILLTYDAAEKPAERRVVISPRRAASAGAVRLGVIGAGNFADAVMLPAIKSAGGIQLVGIAASGGLHAQHAARKFGFGFATSDADAIIDAPEINTIAVLTRHDSHAALVVKALRAGKHVFVEKPLALNEAQLKQVIAALKGKTSGPGAASAPQPGPCLLTIGFNRRFSPLAAELHRFFEDRTEALFAHYRVNAGLLPQTHWTHDPSLGGGRIVGEACHFIDFITFLVGSSPVDVVAQALPDAGKYRRDNVTIRCTFADGSIGVVDYLSNGDRSFPKERLEVFAGGRIAVLDDFRTLETIVDGRRSMVRRRQDKGWVNEWKAFRTSIAEGGEPPIPYDQLIGVTRATFAAEHSLSHPA